MNISVYKLSNRKVNFTNMNLLEDKLDIIQHFICLEVHFYETKCQKRMKGISILNYAHQLEAREEGAVLGQAG